MVLKGHLSHAMQVSTLGTNKEYYFDCKEFKLVLWANYKIIIIFFAIFIL